MPVAMKRLAGPEKMAWQFDYRIDWDAPVAAVPPPVAARAQRLIAGPGAVDSGAVARVP